MSVSFSFCLSLILLSIFSSCCFYMLTHFLVLLFCHLYKYHIFYHILLNKMSCVNFCTYPLQSFKYICVFLLSFPLFFSYFLLDSLLFLMKTKENKYSVYKDTGMQGWHCVLPLSCRIIILDLQQLWKSIWVDYRLSSNFQFGVSVFLFF